VEFHEKIESKQVETKTGMVVLRVPVAVAREQTLPVLPEHINRK